MTFDMQTDRCWDIENDDLKLVADIIEGFTSDDPSVRHDATLKANNLIQQEEDKMTKSTGKVGTGGESVTCVKSSTTTNLQENGHGDESEFLNIANFLTDLSMKDIQMRKITRPQRKKESDELRKLANLAFADKDYQMALDFYSKAIDLTRDSVHLYTNRAFTHIMLGSYENAVIDCDRAIFIAEFSLKARLYKAKALFLQGETALSLACLEQARKILPSHQPAIDHCEKSFFEPSEPTQDKANDDTFLHEKFMRLATRFNVQEMNNFFAKNNSIV